VTKDDIIRIAKEAGMQYREHLDQMATPYCDGVYMEELERFAALVAAATLKNSVMTDEEYEQAMADEGQRRMLEIDTEVRAMIKEAVDAEREACAEVCDRWATNRYDISLLSTAIRARGQG
jgi:hypothetical protein